MASTFEKPWPLTLSAFLWKVIATAIVVDLLVLGFILLRRTYRKRYFAKRDALVFELRQKWDAIISGVIPFEEWRHKPAKRRIVESIAGLPPEQRYRLVVMASDVSTGRLTAALGLPRPRL